MKVSCTCTPNAVCQITGQMMGRLRDIIKFEQDRTYMVHVMLGLGWPSTKHTNETLVSGPATTFFSSSLRRTVGGTERFYCMLVWLEREFYLFFQVQQPWTISTFEAKLTIDNDRDWELFRDWLSSDLSLAMVRSSILSCHLFKAKRVVRLLMYTPSC